MTKYSLKVALWSALVIPGAGQLFLKRYLSGVFYVVISITSLVVIIGQVIVLANGIVDHMNSDAMQAEFSGVIGAVSSGMKTADINLMALSFGVFIFVWLLSILDAYRVGNQLDIDLSVKFRS